MITNYIKIAFRNIFRQKVFSIINILGLSVGIAAFLLIVLYVMHEFSVDKHFTNANRIYRLTLDMRWENAPMQKAAVAPSPLAYQFAEDYAGVEAGTRFTLLDDQLMEYYSDNDKMPDKQFYEKDLIITDSSFFKVFDLELVEGDKETALNTSNNMVLSESMVKKYFGDTNPIGKSILVNKNEKLLVTAIMKDIPENTHFRANAIISKIGDTLFHTSNWRSLDLYSWVLLAENTDMDQMQQNLLQMEDKYYEPWKDESDFRMQKLSDIYLKNDRIFDYARTNNLLLLYLLIVTAVLILIIACINYMNLSTARSIYRSKEVGVRKVVGAQRRELVFQFMGESVLIALFSLFIAVVLTESFLPEFRKLTDTSISLNYLEFIPWFIVLVLLIGLLAGSYPALYTSGFKPVSALKGSLRIGKGSVRIRRVLVIFQFFIMSLLIIISGIVMLQMNYINNKERGYNSEEVIYVELDNLNSNNATLAMKSKLKSWPGVLSVASSDIVPVNGAWGDHFKVEGMEDFFPVRTFSVDADFIPAFGMQIAAGRNFIEGNISDTNTCIINETAAKQFGWKPNEAIGKKMEWNFSRSWDDIIKGKVIGVVKDFHFTSLHQKIEPLILTMHNPVNSYISIRIRPEAQQETLTYIEEVFNEEHTGYIFNYKFLDTELENNYQLEKRAGSIIFYFVILTIFIASLGLAGLTLFMIERRYREIGIRKTFGAGIRKILMVFNKEFLKWVIIANVLAWPLAWILSEQLLSNFAYRITIPWWWFIVTALFTIALSFVTVSLLVYRAATKNPVDALKYE